MTNNISHSFYSFANGTRHLSGALFQKIKQKFDTFEMTEDHQNTKETKHNSIFVGECFYMAIFTATRICNKQPNCQLSAVYHTSLSFNISIKEIFLQ